MKNFITFYESTNAIKLDWLLQASECLTGSAFSHLYKTCKTH